MLLAWRSSAPEDGQNHRPKHGEVIGIINIPLFLHLVGVYIIYINDARSNKYQICKNVVKSTYKLFLYVILINRNLPRQSFGKM